MLRQISILKSLILLGTVFAMAPAHAQQASGPHPLAAELEAAARVLARMQENIADYSCALIRRERIDGVLRPAERMRVKLRHERVEDGRVVSPFSVHLRFLNGRALRGREILYVQGRNDDNLLVRKGGRVLPFVTITLAPDSAMAMDGNRFPVTAIGIQNLLRRLLMIGRSELQYGECEVTRSAGRSVAGRECAVLEVKHPVRREHFQYHLARVFIDEALQLPIRFESYDWPQNSGDPPPLLEEYTYLDLELNVGLTDWDFDAANESYGFGRRRQSATQVASREKPDKEPTQGMPQAVGADITVASD